jgi:large subunit ribosomal protein L10
MPSQQNIDQLTAIKANVEKSQNVIIADYSGLSVKDQTDLRAKLKDAGGELAVNKNRLLTLALKDRLKDLPETVTKTLEGPNATLYSYTDPVSATKVLVEFAKDHESLTVKMGVMLGQEGSPDQVLTKDQVIALAKLPGRQELLAMLVSRLNAPISGLVNVLAGPTRNLVYVLNAIKDKQNA